MIQSHIIALGKPGKVPVDSVEYCLTHYDEAAPFLRNALERAANGELRGGNDENLVFRGIHIMAACRDESAFQPVLRFLRRPYSEADAVLGDATTETLQRIAIGLFDGDAWLLFAAIVSADVDEYARGSLLAAAAFLTWEGRIGRDKIIELLSRIGTERLGDDSEVFCYEWSEAIARLGLRELKPLVLDAVSRNALTSDFWLAEAFDLTLDMAEREPNEAAPFTAGRIGPIENVVALLQEWDADAEQALATPRADRVPEMTVLQPAFDPWRDVGRNDPCPCGSEGKRCCLAA
ncbi:MAG TPA: DUF1186 domain-containing protein [Reyranella sp.]|nr:DUF1186 domain-containing protein [Reyranella sp.]